MKTFNLALLCRRPHLCSAPITHAAADQAPAPAATQTEWPASVKFDNVLYGAAYYHEYMPYDRVDKDAEMMKQAGISVVRMGESTWSLWEPEEGRFEYAWMDRVVEAMGKAGIKIIMGTPTYSIPTWMAHKYPEMLARPLGGASVGYGMRQNMDTDNPKFRFYAQRVIKNMVEHYKDNPNVIGWQIDNETSSYGASNLDVYNGFVDHLKKKYGTTENLNKAWFLNYWGQDVDRLGEHAHPRQCHQHQLQTGVEPLEPDARHRFSFLPGRARSPVSRAEAICHARLRRHDAPGRK